MGTIDETTNDLPVHLQRVLEEKISLDDKIGKLRAFLHTKTFAEQSLNEQQLMQRQLLHMQNYSGALAERLVMHYNRGKTVMPKITHCGP